MGGNLGQGAALLVRKEAENIVVAHELPFRSHMRVPYSKVSERSTPGG
jgi:hypothetical protein